MEQYTMSENICPQIFYKQIKKSCKSYSKKKKEISMQMMMYKNMLEQIDADMSAIRKGKSIM